MKFHSKGHFLREKFWDLFFLGKAMWKHQSFPMKKCWYMIFIKQNKTSKHPSVYYCELVFFFLILSWSKCHGNVELIIPSDYEMVFLTYCFHSRQSLWLHFSLHRLTGKWSQIQMFFYFLCHEPDHMLRLVDGAKRRMLQGSHLRDLLWSQMKGEKRLWLPQKQELRADARSADLFC